MKFQTATIYYDGLCIACSTEIKHYKKQVGANKFAFVDITHADFKPEEHGIDPFLAHKVMHVRDTQGILRQGVDAFRAIWQELPRYQFLARWSERKTFRSILDKGYQFFVVIRPYLPRRKAYSSCSEI